MIKTAVFVAAGMGSRFGTRTENCPKGFLEIDGVPIIEHSINKLLELGIEKIFIGTGFLSEMYEKLVFKYPCIICVYNPEYETTGSMHTLFRLKDYIEEDFILLESDLIYEKHALKCLLKSQHSDVILASKFTHSGDEVFIEVDKKNQLLNMSKKREKLSNIYGELMGITKLSYGTFREMCNFAESVLSLNPKMDYEQALTGISIDVNLHVLKLENIAWCEVDDEGHWERAVEFIYPIIKSRERIAAAPVKRNILLNPGPATTTDSVKFAQIVADICPREKTFGEVMEFISEELTKFVASEEEYTTILFGGSGTAAVESILSSVVGETAIVIINNGAYGKRMCQIAEAYQLHYVEYESPLEEAIDLAKLEAFVRNRNDKISHLAIVHNETTTGLLNPIQEVGKICEKYKIKMIVDAMSSFAAIPINMKQMNISYLAASSNKNLQGVAGVSFVIANKRHLEITKYIRPRSFYLHLYSQYQHFDSTKQMRFTPPVQTLYALKQAILETKWEGIQNRYARYTKSWETLIEGITRMGLTHLIDTDHHSKIITAIIEPPILNYDFNAMHDFFYDRGFTIYPGKFDKLNTFRIANIGDIDEIEMKEFVFLLEQYMNNLK